MSCHDEIYSWVFGSYVSSSDSSVFMAWCDIPCWFSASPMDLCFCPLMVW